MWYFIHGPRGTSRSTEHPGQCLREKKGSINAYEILSYVHSDEVVDGKVIFKIDSLGRWLRLHYQTSNSLLGLDLLV